MCVLKKGFTLAEVLITLLIIGVIASIVIPGLIADTQNAELKTTWKKTFADLNQATKLIMMDNGGNLTGISNFTSSYKTILNSVKYCSSASAEGCWNKANESFYISGGVAGSPENSPDKSFAYPGLILNNGIFITSFTIDSTCQYNPPYKYCGWMAIDVNGLKRPNTVGKDIFAVWLLKDGIKAIGTQNTFVSTDDCATGTGWTCSAKYLYQ